MSTLAEISRELRQDGEMITIPRMATRAPVSNRRYFTLYFDVMQVDPTNPEWDERDRFVLSRSCMPYSVCCLETRIPLDREELLLFDH